MAEIEHVNENKYLVQPSLLPVLTDAPGMKANLSRNKGQKQWIPSREMERNVKRLITHFEEKD